MNFIKYTPLLLCVLLLSACGKKTHSDQLSGIGDQMGTIDFPVSGNDEAQRHMERGIKLLHHMTYSEADKEFVAAIEADPDRALEMCALYSDVAPDVPHALHMPTHIFTRAGLWSKSIELNLRAAKTTRTLDAGKGGNDTKKILRNLL
jgi:hypothetical protein